MMFLNISDEYDKNNLVNISIPHKLAYPIIPSVSKLYKINYFFELYRLVIVLHLNFVCLTIVGGLLLNLYQIYNLLILLDEFIFLLSINLRTSTYVCEKNQMFMRKCQSRFLSIFSNNLINHFITIILLF